MYTKSAIPVSFHYNYKLISFGMCALGVLGMLKACNRFNVLCNFKDSMFIILCEFKSVKCGHVCVRSRGY